MSPLGPAISMLSVLFCISAALEDDRPCIRVDVCEGGKLVDVNGTFIRHEVFDDCSGGKLGGGVTRMASSP